MLSVQYKDIIKFHKSSCDRCVSLIYDIPCAINKNIINYLTKFGVPVYSLDTGNLLKIESEDHYTIETRLDNSYIKFGMPKELEYTDWNTTTRKLEFEESLKQWIEDLLQILIVR